MQWDVFAQSIDQSHFTHADLKLGNCHDMTRCAVVIGIIDTQHWIYDDLDLQVDTDDVCVNSDLDKRCDID